MATATATAGIGALTGEIKFSQLRRTFLKMNARATFSDSETFNAETGSVSASQLLRDTTGTNPNVPDSTENAAIATTNDWKPSQFNNALKYYYVQQTGNEEDYNIGSQSWNNNLPLSIRKFMFIDGRCEATGPTSPACKLITTSRNVRIDVSGQIYGAGGTPGLAGVAGSNFINGGNGGKGGTSLEVNASANNIVVFVRDTAEIFAGGGGGGGGGAGGDGGDGGSGSYTYPCGSHCIHFGGYCGSCPPSLESQGTHGNCSPGVPFHHCCQRHTIYCTASSDGSAGGTGGNAGAGGKGRGWNNTSNVLDGPVNGVAGISGTAGTVGSNGGGSGGDGGAGGNGGNGGQHGEPGVSGTDGISGADGADGNVGEGTDGITGGLGGDGGAAGNSLSGAGYSYTGTINTSGANVTIAGPIAGGTEI